VKIVTTTLQQNYALERDRVNVAVVRADLGAGSGFCTKVPFLLKSFFRDVSGICAKLNL